MIPALIPGVAVLMLAAAVILFGVVLFVQIGVRQELRERAVDTALLENRHTAALKALRGAVERLGDELQADRFRELVGRRVTVHTTDGQTVRGVVVVELEDGGLDLESAEYPQADGSALPCEGRIRILGARRSWLQIVEG